MLADTGQAGRITSSESYAKHPIVGVSAIHTCAIINEMPKSPKKLKTLFVHEWGSFPASTLISIGFTHKEVVKWCKGKNVIKDFASWIENDVSVKKAYSGTDGGVFVYGTDDYKNDKRSYSVLVIKDFEDAWNCWEILLHELHHGVFWISKKFAIGDETEAQAYTFDRAFRTIRRKLQKLD